MVLPPFFDTKEFDNFMTNLISYVFTSVLELLVSDYFVYAFGVILPIGLIGLTFMLIRGKSR